MNILPAKKNSSWKDACKNLKQMFEKCPRILRECLTEREYKNFVDEFLIDIRATVIAMEDICPIAKKNTLGEKVNKIRIWKRLIRWLLALEQLILFGVPSVPAWEKIPQ